MWWSLPQFQEDNWPTLLINIFRLFVSKCHPYIYLNFFNSTVANTNNIPCDHRFIEALVELWEEKKKRARQRGTNNIAFNSAFSAKLRLWLDLCILNT